MGSTWSFPSLLISMAHVWMFRLTFFVSLFLLVPSPHPSRCVGGETGLPPPSSKDELTSDPLSRSTLSLENRSRRRWPLQIDIMDVLALASLFSLFSPIIRWAPPSFFCTCPLARRKPPDFSRSGWLGGSPPPPVTGWRCAGKGEGFWT